MADCVSCSIRLQDYLMIKTIGNNHIDIFDFLHEGIHQGKIASKTAAVSWVWPGVPLSQWDSGIL